MSKSLSKKDRRMNETKELQQKQLDANNRYTEARKIMIRENKAQADYEKAIQLFTEAITLLQNSQTFSEKVYGKYHSQRGSTFMQVGEYQNAYYDFCTAIRFDDNNSTYYGHKGNCLLELKQVDEALEEFQKAIALNNAEQNSKVTEKEKDSQKDKEKERGYLLLNRGIVYERLGSYETAVNDYNSAIQFLAKDSNALYKAYFHQGYCNRLLGKNAQSIKDLINASQYKKDEPECYNSLGISYFENQQFDLAKEKFNRALELHDSNPLYMSNLGLALHHIDQLEDSLEYFNKSIDIDQSDAKTFHNRANTLLKLGKNQEAQSDLDQAILLESNYYAIYHTYGLAYQECQEYQKAIDMFQKSLTLKQNDKASMQHLGQMQHKAGLLEEAEATFTLSIKLGNKTREVYETRGQVYYDLEKFDLSMIDFNIARELEPSYSYTLYYRGLTRIQLGMYDEALEDLYGSLEYGCKDPGIYNGLGITFRLKKNLDKALYYHNEALEKEPNNKDFLIERSKIFLEKKQFNESIQDLTLALTIAPDNATTLYRRGISYYLNKEFIKSIKDLKLALLNKPKQYSIPDIYYHIGIGLANLELYGEAIEPLNKVIELQSDVGVYVHERAKCHLLNDNAELAVIDFNDVIRIQPKNAHAYFGRGFAYKALQKFDESALDFVKAKQLDPMNPNLVVNFSQLNRNVTFIKLCNPGQEQK